MAFPKVTVTASFPNTATASSSPIPITRSYPPIRAFASSLRISSPPCIRRAISYISGSGTMPSPYNAFSLGSNLSIYPSSKKRYPKSSISSHARNFFAIKGALSVSRNCFSSSVSSISALSASCVFSPSSVLVNSGSSVNPKESTKWAVFSPSSCSTTMSLTERECPL